jgi:predicted metal-dependent HD superfamily phosphohydrolase
MTTQNIYRTLKLVEKAAREMMPNGAYHNYRFHIIDVRRVLKKYARIEKLTAEEKLLLAVAADLHDWGYIPGRKDNEERAADFSRETLRVLGYSPRQIEIVANMIMATKMPQKPKTFLEMLLCDADLDNLGREGFFDSSERVREELGIPAGENWDRNNLAFLENHGYHTEIARRFRSDGKIRNIAKLKQLIGERYGA